MSKANFHLYQILFQEKVEVILESKMSLEKRISLCLTKLFQWWMVVTFTICNLLATGTNMSQKKLRKLNIFCYV